MHLQDNEPVKIAATNASIPVDAPSKFQIFRWKNGSDLAESKAMRYEGMTSTIERGLSDMLSAGLNDGHDIRVLFEAPGFSLTHAWFKAGYPLPLHTHDVHCLYYVISGALRLGINTLNAGDGFLVPANVPYTYTPCADGVEVVEFRTAESFNIRFLAKGPAFWDNAVKTIEKKREAWKTQLRPPVNARLT